MDLKQYFNIKKIDCIIEELKTDAFITYKITLKDINDLKKFNNTMVKELSYYLKDESLQLKIDSKINITVKNKNLCGFNSDFLRYQKSDDAITVNIGTDTSGHDIFINMSSDPHWLIAGSTGSGKSVFMNNCIIYLLKNYSYKINTYFIDLKQVEFNRYNKLTTNGAKVATTYEDAVNILDRVAVLMNNRYKLLKKKRYSNISEYNANEPKKLKYIFLFIDELAELMQVNKKEISRRVGRLLQLARASGIYIIAATQRPSADVLPGLLKTNFTTRLAFRVGNMYDSKTIINEKGAERLSGRGDGLLLNSGSFKVRRFQAFNVSPDVSDDIISQLKNKWIF